MKFSLAIISTTAYVSSTLPNANVLHFAYLTDCHHGLSHVLFMKGKVQKDGRNDRLLIFEFVLILLFMTARTKSHIVITHHDLQYGIHVLLQLTPCRLSQHLR